MLAPRGGRSSSGVVVRTRALLSPLVLVLGACWQLAPSRRWRHEPRVGGAGVGGREMALYLTNHSRLDEEQLRMSLSPFHTPTSGYAVDD